MTTVLPTLYKRTSTGAIQTWTMYVKDNYYFTEHGQLDGKLQITDGTRAYGKNQGRANATTDDEQALVEAKAQWERKLKSGYVQSLADAHSGAVDSDFITGGISPMLAQTYSKRAHKISFPAAVQPKFDGHRCLAVVNDDNTVSLWSRSRKPITGVPHVARAVEVLKLAPGTVLDGELYNHDYRENFEELTSFIRQKTPKVGHNIVEYHVYDIAGTGTFAQRHAALLDIFAMNTSFTLVGVKTLIVRNEDELMDAFADFTAEGYEGAIVRNLDGLYVNKRTDDLQKVKEFEDAEFEVVRVEQGRGRMEGRAIFVCQAPGGEFRAKMMGDLQALEAYVTDPTLAVGRQLTVKYQAMTAAGVPRFPVGVRFRQDA